MCAVGAPRISAAAARGDRPAGRVAHGGRSVHPPRRNLYGAMTRAVALLLWCAALFVPASAAADPRLVPDVSSRAIEIQYSFTGEELLLFGARSEEHTSELQSLMR